MTRGPAPEDSPMDRVTGVSSAVSPLQEYARAVRDAQSLAADAPKDQPESDLVAVLDPRNQADPAKEKQLMAHFMSHVDAECFLSLLKMTDPMPREEPARTMWKRHYSQLRDVLTIPLPPPDPRPSEPPADPLL